MGLILLDSPAAYSAAFGKNKIKMQTTNNSVGQLKYSIELSGVSLSTQYIPVYAVYLNGSIDHLEAMIDVKGLYTSMLYSYDNILNTTSLFEELNMTNHQEYVTEWTYEDIIGGDSKILNRWIFKAVELNNPEKWDDSKNYIPIQENEKGEVYRKVYKGQKIPICQYTQNINISSDVTLIESTGSTIIGQLSANTPFRCAMWKVDTNDSIVTININNSSPSIKLIVDNRPYKNIKVLYFLNRYGGWDWFFSNHYETREVTTKSQYTKYKNVEGDIDIMQIIDGTIIEQKLYSDPLNSESYEYLKDMINSPLILDDDGNRVRLIDNTIRYDFKDLIEPVFTIQYIKKENIIY